MQKVEFLEEDHFEKILAEYLEKLDFEGLVKDVFLLYLPLKIEHKLLFKILKSIHEEFKIPFRDIKIIGSSHLGFSLCKKSEKNPNELKKFDENSDIDIAIINQELFYRFFNETITISKRFSELTKFYKKEDVEKFKQNILKGYIRPDTIPNCSLKNRWYRFFKELSIEINKKVSAAVYLNEKTFYFKLKEAIDKYQNIKKGEI